MLLFKEFFQSGYIPHIWKHSFLKAIHKDGDKANIENYRAVANPCIIFKLLAEIFYVNLYNVIFPSLYSEQYGFRKGHSIINNMFKFANETAETLDKGFQMDSVYLDYSKAFDKVDIDLMVRKLDHIGIRDKALTWIKSYLFGRKPAVSLKGSYSNWFDCTSGVAQGSHSGSL